MLDLLCKASGIQQHEMLMGQTKNLPKVFSPQHPPVPWLAVAPSAFPLPPAAMTMQKSPSCRYRPLLKPEQALQEGWPKAHSDVSTSSRLCCRGGSCPLPPKSALFVPLSAGSRSQSGACVMNSEARDIREVLCTKTDPSARKIR